MRLPEPERPWWQIPDFDPSAFDIKLIWELSRFDWVLAFAQRARQGDLGALRRLNVWLADWSERNRPYRGANWKCGQESSIRVMHLAMAARILGQVERPLPGLLDLVHAHLDRIWPTMQYAVGQDNNHGTSEATALFIGGSWLATGGSAQGERWQASGRRWLEERTLRLVAPDGSFSQHSLNYHRLLLDTLSMAEVWRRELDLPRFSDRWRTRAAAAARWLYDVISPETGDGPNLGANDGALLLPLTDADYRDFRGTVQLSMALFADAIAYATPGQWWNVLEWLDVPAPASKAPAQSSRQADDGGLFVLRRGTASAIFRYPRFRFRPGHADLLHVDLSLAGVNVLRDGGTFSYNADSNALLYFSGTASHNTIQFDGRDQMPRIGRFLFGEWPEALFVDPLTEEGEALTAGAGYKDREGACHERRIRLASDALCVSDEVGGFRRSAVLRWRLLPDEWRVEERSQSRVDVISEGGQDLSICVRASVPIRRAELVEGWESRYYMETSAVPVFEVEIGEAGALVTYVTWKP